MITILLSQLSNPLVKILLKLGGIFLVALSAYLWHRSEVNHYVNLAEQKLIQQYQEDYNNSLNQVNKSNQALLQSAYDKLYEKENEIKTITTDRDRLLDELRNRPKRTVITNPTVAKNPTTCTGAELFREDAEFLTREATRADQILIERNKYYELYEQARLELEKLAKQLKREKNG